MAGAPLTNPTSIPGVYRIFPGAGVMYLDAVPEPGTLVLLATGLIGLLAYAWRKRK